MLFFFLFFFLFVCGVLEIYGKLSNLKVQKLFFFTIVILFVLSFIRWERGTDWGSYYDYFVENNRLDEFFLSFEVGYGVLNYFVKTYIGGFTMLLFCMGSCIYFLKSKILYNYSPYPLVSLLFFLGYSFGDIYFVRQSLAVSILFFSFQYIIQRHFFKFLFCIIIASTFHVTSIIFLFAYWIYLLKLKNNRFLIILFAGILFAYVLGVSIVTLLGQTASGFLALKIAAYTEAGTTETFGLTESPIRILVSGTIGKIFFLLIALWGTLKTRMVNPITNGVINIYAFGIVLYVMMVQINVTMGRLSSCYDFFLVLLIPIALHGLRLQRNKLIIFLLLVFYSFKGLYGNLNGSYGKYYIPYKSIFNKEISVDVG